MIKGLHGMFYSAQAEELRAFMRDKLQLPYTDIGRGWLVFGFAEGDVGVHPADPETGRFSGTHNVSFFCDDIEATVATLRDRGVAFLDDVSDQGYGFVIHFEMPGGVKVQLYQPRYTKNAS